MHNIQTAVSKVEIERKKFSYATLEELLFAADCCCCFVDNVLAKMLWYVGVSLTTYDAADVGDVSVGTLLTSSKLLSLCRM